METESTRHVLTVLYPLYKEEVHRRREQMMTLTAWGATGLVAMLFAVLLNPDKTRLTTPETCLIGFAALMWSALFCSLIEQQRDRHRLAKQILIQLERTLGFYEEGLFVENQALYPNGWQTAWLRDKSSILYFACLGVLTGLILLALFFI
jgi:uncharacterized membrane protein